MTDGVNLETVLILALAVVFVARLWVHDRRRHSALSTAARIEYITEKVRNPLRYRMAATLRVILG